MKLPIEVTSRLIQEWDRDKVIEMIMPRLAALEKQIKKDRWEYNQDRFHLHLQFKDIGMDITNIEEKITELQQSINKKD